MYHVQFRKPGAPASYLSPTGQWVASADDAACYPTLEAGLMALASRDMTYNTRVWSSVVEARVAASPFYIASVSSRMRPTPDLRPLTPGWTPPRLSWRVTTEACATAFMIGVLVAQIATLVGW